MKSTPALDALRAMRRVVVPVPERDEENARRERIAARVLELSLQLRAQRQRRLGVAVAFGGLMAAAAAVLLVQWGPWFGAESASARIVSGHMAVRDGAELRAWAEPTLDLEREPVVQTGATEAVSLELPSRAAVDVASASELALVRRKNQGGWSERIDLRTGGVKLRVPKLATNQHLAVQTSDALVEVRGTRFGVHIEHDSLGAFTRVDVEEGRVAVRSERGPSMLGPGEHWTSREPVAAPLAPEPVAAPIEALPAKPSEEPLRVASNAKRAPEAAADEPATEAVQDTPASVLAEQNRLLQAAALAKRSGLPKLALARLETLLDTYPQAELANNARVEHFRLLRDTGQLERARASARLYLERYPHGFAVAEARRVLEPTVDAP